MLLPRKCVLSGLSKYGRPISKVGRIMLTPSFRTLKLIYPNSTSRSIMTDSSDHWLWKSKSPSQETSMVSHYTFKASCRLFNSPVPVSKKTSKRPGFASGIGLSKLKIG
jgi:hypothetical protein